MKFWKKEPATVGGLILGYEITEPVFKPILDLSSKGEQGWKLPTFIENIADNPAPLILEERWLYDEGAVKRAFGWLRRNKVKGVEKLEYVFKESKNFEGISLQSYFNTTDDVNEITEIMRKCNYDFHEAIKPLEMAYGEYAYPNNYEFERMNAGIVSCISKKYPNLQPMDDSLRVSVYDWLGNTSQVSNFEENQILDKVIRAAKNSLFPIPKFAIDWDPVEFVKLHSSKGAQQLRELVSVARTPNPNDADTIDKTVQNARVFSTSISPTREVIYALSGFGGAVVSAIQSIINPLFYIPTAIFAVVSADQLYMTFKSWQKKGQIRWLEVADQLAYWYSQKRNDNDKQ